MLSKKMLLSTGLGVIFAGVVVLNTLTTIPAGYAGVEYSPNGGVKERTLSQGWHLVSQVNKITKYTVATEQAYLSADRREGSRDDDSFMVPTSDGKLVNVDLEFSYRFDSERLSEVFTKFRGRTGEEIQETFMRGKIKTWTGEVTSKYNVLEIYGEKRVELNAQLYTHVKKEFETYGIVIESVNLSRIGLDTQTAQAIQARVNAQQDLERQKTEKQKAIIEAERLAIEEEGKKKVKVIKAQAEAEEITLKANAQAEANTKLSKSITQELVEYEKTKRWDGKLPQISGSVTPMIDMRTK
ncbi:MAG: prohibitin family protein [Paraclostridium sp.]